jgi:hypothetical protein
LVPGDGLDGVEVYGTHVPFLSEEARADCLLRTHRLPIPDVDWGERVFSSGGLWSLYRCGDRYAMPFASPRTGPRPYRLALFDRHFRVGDLYVPPSDVGMRLDTEELGPGTAVADPLLSPLDELIVVNRLSQDGGLYLHACGLSVGGRAIAFCGVSGAGKSTMARLWKDEPVTLLSDDRLIVRSTERDYVCWGTPWHGDALEALPLSAPLRKLYFIEHASTNFVRPLSAHEAALRLLVRCFPTYYDAGGMEHTLDIVFALASSVPCAVLGFVPDERVVDLVWNDSLRG